MISFVKTLAQGKARRVFFTAGSITETEARRRARQTPFADTEDRARLRLVESALRAAHTGGEVPRLLAFEAQDIPFEMEAHVYLDVVGGAPLFLTVVFSEARAREMLAAGPVVETACTHVAAGRPLLDGLTVREEIIAWTKRLWPDLPSHPFVVLEDSSVPVAERLLSVSQRQGRRPWTVRLGDANFLRRAA